MKMENLRTNRRAATVKDPVLLQQKAHHLLSPLSRFLFLELPSVPLGRSTLWRTVL